MGMITLKVKCSDCDGQGFYPYSTPHGPCWVCKGKGWHNAVMVAPDPKWAKQAKKGPTT